MNFVHHVCFVLFLLFPGMVCPMGPAATLVPIPGGASRERSSCEEQASVGEGNGPSVVEIVPPSVEESSSDDDLSESYQTPPEAFEDDKTSSFLRETGPWKLIGGTFACCVVAYLAWKIWRHKDDHQPPHEAGPYDANQWAGSI